MGVNIKGLDIKKVYRGCYATNNKKAFEYCDLIKVKVKENKLFKAKTQFGTQIHVTIGMFTFIGYIFPYYEKDGKMIQMENTGEIKIYNAYLWLNEQVFINKEKTTMLLSRLDLAPTTLRILGSAELIEIANEPPKMYKFKIKKGIVQNPNHTQGIVCSGLAQSFEGGKKLIGRKLEPPFSKVIGTFGTKGNVIVGVETKDHTVKKGDPVVLKELRSFTLKSKKDLNL